MRKDASGITFQRFAWRIMSVWEYDNANVKLPIKIIQKGFTLRIPKWKWQALTRHHLQE